MLSERVGAAVRLTLRERLQATTRGGEETIGADLPA
jgi:hypothetical protein